MITVTTDEWNWWFHYQYQGTNIDVQMDKNWCGPETAMNRATWAIHDAIEELDGNRRTDH